jgi:hypothetical protein
MKETVPPVRFDDSGHASSEDPAAFAGTDVSDAGLAAGVRVVGTAKGPVAHEGASGNEKDTLLRIGYATADG